MQINIQQFWNPKGKNLLVWLTHTPRFFVNCRLLFKDPQHETEVIPN